MVLRGGRAALYSPAAAGRLRADHRASQLETGQPSTSNLGDSERAQPSMSAGRVSLGGSVLVAPYRLSRSRFAGRVKDGGCARWGGARQGAPVRGTAAADGERAGSRRRRDGPKSR